MEKETKVYGSVCSELNNKWLFSFDYGKREIDIVVPNEELTMKTDDLLWVIKNFLEFAKRLATKYNYEMNKQDEE